MYEVYVQAHFSAAHRLDGYPGNCARWHGHNWQVTVYLQTKELNSIGLAVDFREVKDKLDLVLSKFDHAALNEVPELEGDNPTCENVARYVYHAMAQELNRGNLRVARVQVSETPTAGVTYYE